MRFVVARWGDEPKGGLPCVVLATDNWDDFGYKTMFHANLWLPGSQKVELGAVKILRRANAITTDAIPRHFEHLEPKDYCSVGQGLEYYKALSGLPAEQWRSILAGLCDVVLEPSATEWRESDDGYATSLLRFSGAAQAMEEAAYLLGLATRPRPFRRTEFAFSTLLDGASAPHIVRFVFDAAPPLPRRLAVLIGKNGTGKTTLLRNIAACVGGWGLKVGNTMRRPDEVGTFPDGRPSVGTVIAVSFSAFDDFQRPKLTLSQQAEMSVSYRYVGNRASSDDSRLLTPDELWKNFSEYATEAKNRGQVTVGDDEIACDEVMRAGLQTLLGGDLVNGLCSPASATSRAAWQAMSSGQRIVAYTVAGLSASVDDGAMVLMDEPETHLHPGLLSTLMAVLDVLLGAFGASAIVATHHPFVVQQVPSDAVIVLTRHGNLPQARNPPFQTFGADLGDLLQFALGLAEPERDWHHSIEGLVSDIGTTAALAHFSPELGLDAKTYLRSLAKTDET